MTGGEGVEVLVLHGSPGSGKTTLSRSVSEILRRADVAHAVIDLDDLDRVYPHRGRAFVRDNLRGVWPNYTAKRPLKVIIPSLIANEQERDDLRAAVPAARFLVCELTAPEAVLRHRVTEREAAGGEYWQTRLLNFVDMYNRRTDLTQIRDFLVATNARSTEEAAKEIIDRAGWTLDSHSSSSQL
ncbi:AAA family ATPase [Microlunatus antarcticus]|uniref:Putative kinase n=1 Tax=Microlunatus antarcticus TaxID=53388 RepID=A0A7W5JUA0_9ACTN|nr:AAA family ATPase [Microlunatus antarcticus]MBB3326469.1 putative kinase [Microlunatus antarcticus]